jgi:flagellar biosynthesis/type III secretory pathway protein FliH
MIAAPTRSFSFPTRGQVGASRGPCANDPNKEAQAVKEAIARGYADGFAQGRLAGEAQARSDAETARKDGFEAGRKEAFAQVDQAAAALREALAQFEGERSEMACKAESFCVDLVLAVVSRLVESDQVRA